MSRGKRLLYSLLVAACCAVGAAGCGKFVACDGCTAWLPCCFAPGALMARRPQPPPAPPPARFHPVPTRPVFGLRAVDPYPEAAATVQEDQPGPEAPPPPLPPQPLDLQPPDQRPEQPVPPAQSPAPETSEDRQARQSSPPNQV